MFPENEKVVFKRKFISLDEKIQILDRLKDGEKVSSVARSFNLNEATIRTIQKSEQKIRKNVAEGYPLGAKRLARSRDINLVKMEQALMIWMEDCLDKGIPLTGNIIRQKALKIYEQLKETGQSSAEQTHSFGASKGWFEKLKARFSLHNVKFRGEQAMADAERSNKFKEELPEIIEEGKYTADQIFNADEAALHWKKLPSRTYISKDEKSVPRHKMIFNGLEKVIRIKHLLKYYPIIN